MFTLRQRSVLPGFNLTIGFTLFYLSLIVLIPLAGTFVKTFSLSWEQFWGTITSPRVLASYRITFGASFLAALVNLFFGLLVAWVLVRYRFPGKLPREQWRDLKLQPGFQVFVHLQKVRVFAENQTRDALDFGQLEAATVST